MKWYKRAASLNNVVYMAVVVRKEHLSKSRALIGQLKPMVESCTKKTKQSYQRKLRIFETWMTGWQSCGEKPGS
jgi:hypothetical protein